MTERPGRRGAACLAAGVLLGAFAFVAPGTAGEVTDFSGPYVGFNLGYGTGSTRERGPFAPDPGGRGATADPALPPSAEAAARALRARRGGATEIGR